MISFRRLSILKRYLQNPAQYPYLSYSEILKHLVSPTSTMVAHQQIRRMEDMGNGYLACHLKDGLRPLYWPKLVKLRWLYQVISEAFWTKNWHYYEISKTMVRPGDVVVDCGAAEGLFALMILGRAKGCYLIEPLPVFQRALALTFAGVAGYEVLPVALGTAPGECTFQEDGIMSAVTEKGNVTVRIETLDRLFYERGIHVDYIKADLEGAEMDMLRGAAQTIRASKPRIAITLYHQGQNHEEMINYIQSLVPEYRYLIKGINAANGNPVMGHFWVE